jgi:uncharacterized protein YjbJ (UPF0337 family)
MDADRVKGTAKDIAGRVERQAGEWTGNKNMEAEGAAKQVEGKVQNAVGKAKDAVRDLRDEHREKKDKEVNEDTAELDTRRTA